MCLCIPTVDDRGLDGVLSPHFGGSAYFTLITSDGSIKVLPNRAAHHEPGSCEGGEVLRGLGVHVVICRRIGRNAMKRLHASGMSVLGTHHQDVKGALEAHRAGRLEPLSLEEACHGGRHEGRACRKPLQVMKS